MFGREAATPIDSVLQMERTAGETVTYPEFVVKQREQIEATEQLVRESLGRAQTKQKTHYAKRLLGQCYQVGDIVWYRNRQRKSRKRLLKRWCGPWRVLKALSDVTYRIEEEIRKPGKRRPRRVVHFNYLKPCHSSPEEVISSQRTHTESLCAKASTPAKKADEVQIE